MAVGIFHPAAEPWVLPTVESFFTKGLPGLFKNFVLEVIQKCIQLVHGQNALPQQLPGPAHPAACPGVAPQQAVSPSPGFFIFAGPDMAEWADICLLKLVLPQVVHLGSSPVPAMSSSLVRPQSLHVKSNKGMGSLLYPSGKNIFQFVYTEFILFSVASHQASAAPGADFIHGFFTPGSQYFFHATFFHLCSVKQSLGDTDIISQSY